MTAKQEIAAFRADAAKAWRKFKMPLCKRSADGYALMARGYGRMQWVDMPIIQEEDGFPRFTRTRAQLEAAVTVYNSTVVAR